MINNGFITAPSFHNGDEYVKELIDDLKCIDAVHKNRVWVKVNYMHFILRSIAKEYNITKDEVAERIKIVEIMKSYDSFK